MENIDIRIYSKYYESEIITLYKAVGWSNYYEKPQMLEQAFKHSIYILGAYQNNKLIGIIRVVGDGYSIIYIQDLLILPNYQRKGIGSLLIKTVLEKFANVYQKILLTDNKPETRNFYECMGFEASDKFGCISFLKFGN